MSAPSFSSFPPSFPSFPDLEAGPSHSKSSHKSNREKKKRRQRTPTEQGTESLAGRDARRNKDRHKLRSEKNRLPETHGSADSREFEKNNLLFYSDHKGDLMNIQYGGLHAGDIPKYRMVAGGRNVLGLPKDLIVLRRLGRGVEVGLNHQRKAANLSTSASQALLSKPPSRRLIPSAGTDKYEEIDGYISFPSRTASDSADLSYRSISRQNKDDSEGSSSSENESEYSLDQDSDPPVLSAHQETLKRLQQEVEVQPTAVKTWLLLLNQTLSTIPITSKNATKARSEIALSVLSRALSASPQNSKNKVLRLAYLKAGEEIWHESRLRSEWEDALKVKDVEIYIEWLEWKIRKGNNGADGVVEAAVRILDKLDQSSELGKIRIFWRVATALRMAGYTERASAMFQAQAELSFNAPSNLAHMTLQAQLEELEEFWDSEYPRLGEDGARGWASWYSSKTEHRTPSSSQSLVQSQLIDLDPYRQWAGRELELDRKMLVPLRSDSDSLDPYSAILFPDIRPTLLNLKSSEAKHAFRMAWLSFLGIKLPGFSLATDHEMDWDDRWNLGYLTSPHCLDSIFPLDTGINKLSTDAVAGVVIGRERVYNAPFGPVQCWGKDVSGPLDLASAHPGKALRRGLWAKEDLKDVNENFVRHLFLGLKLPRDDTEWDTLTLAFEVAANPKSAIKLSKSFLSVNQASLGLWGIHAQLERLRGRPDDARNVYHTILIASKPDKSKKYIGRMWWNWAEMEWLSGNDQQALDVTLRAAGLEGSKSGVTILRAKRSLEEVAESTKLTNGWKDYEAWVKLRALLELLGGYEPETASVIFDEYLSREIDSSSESLVAASLVMVYCYGTILKKPMPPSILRERAHRAFEQYPSNSIILGILLEAEKGQGVWGRVRGMLGGNDGKVKDVSRRIEEVWIAGWESGRWLSEVERTRNGLAAAVEHERTKSSWVIWRIYIEFEIRVQELQRAKKLLFRSIGECPLVKELYLLAFGPLRSVFQKHELNGLADTMAERGLRLRQGLDEVVVGLDDSEDDEGRDGLGDISEDEIEHNAKELRRLMPY